MALFGVLGALGGAFFARGHAARAVLVDLGVRRAGAADVRANCAEVAVMHRTARDRDDRHQPHSAVSSIPPRSRSLKNQADGAVMTQTGVPPDSVHGSWRWWPGNFGESLLKWTMPTGARTNDLVLVIPYPPTVFSGGIDRVAYRQRKNETA
jgi:hypothetical protein